MRIRLREAHSPEQLAQIYKTPHDHSKWFDHKIRVQATIALASYFGEVTSVADLSAGDATIINAIPAKERYIGDFAPRYELQGSIDETIELIPKVDLFICSETIEHLDDPETTLRKIRAKTKALILSTPDGETGQSNPEHYWGWDMQGVRELLTSTGFSPAVSSRLEFIEPAFTYNYQIWGAR